jgi:hypothetical protein
MRAIVFRGQTIEQFSAPAPRRHVFFQQSAGVLLIKLNLWPKRFEKSRQQFIRAHNVTLSFVPIVRQNVLSPRPHSLF